MSLYVKTATMTTSKSIQGCSPVAKEENDACTTTPKATISKPAGSPRDAAEPDFHKPPERTKEPWFVRLNRCLAKTWLFTAAGVFDFITWPFKKMGLFLLPDGIKFHVYMWWMTFSMVAIWAITICEKLVVKIRAPRTGDVARLFPFQTIAKSFFGKVFPTFGYRRPGAKFTPKGAAAVLRGNDCPFVLVHGLAGWGTGTSWFPSYWGGAEAMDRKIFVPALGPLSSHHHRACELFAQLKGGTVDYGEAISRRLGHDRYGRTYEKALYPEWSATRPLHFVGHSMGGNTVRVLQFLLESGHFAEAAAKLAPMSPPPDYDVHTTGRWKGVPASRPSACWVKSLTCISSPLNGTTFVSFLGVEHRTDTSCAGDLRIRWGSLAHVILILIRCAIYFPWFLRFFGIDLIWDHFEKRRRKEGFRGVLHTIATAKDITLRMHGSCVGDLTINAAAERNSRIPTYECTYYFSYVTQHCRQSPLNSSYYWPDPNMHWLMMGMSAITGRYAPPQKPYPAFRAREWLRNDGPVSVISQCYPFVCTKAAFQTPLHMRNNSLKRRYPLPEWEGVQPHLHAPLVTATFRSQVRPTKGCWYFSPPIYMDHMTVTMAPRNRANHHQNLYSHIRMRAREMSSSHLPDIVGAAVAQERQEQTAAALAASVTPDGATDPGLLLDENVFATSSIGRSATKLPDVQETKGVNLFTNVARREALQRLLGKTLHADVLSEEGSESEMLSPDATEVSPSTSEDDDTESTDAVSTD